ncbi:hypothetical protein BDP27DRAFT_1367236 [Rhodocollybia butyracea]|uniref:Uncharacterized protein n=1 Tax=Rhodocollybia butyracea TaxID=206335 RepID=A0A9P5U3D5_9AGAR|nr:hypothetical protein BDP27DRAFT_1367236 [Rhodocollybia butyracea]
MGELDSAIVEGASWGGVLECIGLRMKVLHTIVGSDKEKSISTIPAGLLFKEGDGLIIKDALDSVEDVPLTYTRRYRLWTVWAFCALIRMKRPDVTLAWRENVTIFWPPSWR